MNRAIAREVAALPPSQLSKYTMYLLCAGLCNMLGVKSPGYEKAVELSRMAHGLIDRKALVTEGIPSLYSAFSPNGEDLRGHGNALKALMKTKISQDPNVPDEVVKALKFAILWVSSADKPTMLDRMKKMSAAVSGKLYRNVERVLEAAEGVTNTPAATAKGVKGVAPAAAPKPAGGGVAALVAQYRTLAAQIDPTNTDGNVTPTQTKEFAALNASNAGVVKEYNRVKRMIGEKYLLDLTKLTSGAGGPVKVHEAFARMNDLGYPFSRVVAAKREIPLRVAAEGGKIKYYTSDGLLLAGAIPANINKIGFPTTYDPATGQSAYMVFKAPTAVGVTRIYTVKHKDAANEAKFDKADAINENLGKFLAQWTRDLNSKDPSKYMAAAVCYIIYLTGARIGSRQFSAASNSGVQTYGIISLRPRHVRIGAGSIIIEYVGKKEGKQKHVIKLSDVHTKKLATILAALKVDKGKEDLLFSVRNAAGALKHIIPKTVNDYLKAMGFIGGAHKMRHVRGTNLVVELLEKNKFKASAKAATNLPARQKEAEDWFKTKILEPVGTLLGHFTGDKVTWRTSIANYINPSVVATWFTNNGMKVPTWVPKVVGGAAADDDE